VDSPNGTIVVIEDDNHISDLVALYLRRDGFRVLQANDGESGLAQAEREKARLVIVDVGLPGEIDGFEVCRRIRRGSETPVVMLTARDDEFDRILGLELGADDYVTKPFSARELTARVHAILRRTGTTAVPTETVPETIVIGPIEIDGGRREIRRDGEVVNLTFREFDLLAYLALNQGLALSRQQLLDGVWGEGWYGDERTVDVHVRQLRKKLGNGLPLATVWGMGYRLG
jgi:DNA-binding response OmpR family regulator